MEEMANSHLNECPLYNLPIEIHLAIFDCLLLLDTTTELLSYLAASSAIQIIFYRNYTKLINRAFRERTSTLFRLKRNQIHLDTLLFPFDTQERTLRYWIFSHDDECEPTYSEDILTTRRKHEIILSLQEINHKDGPFLPCCRVPKELCRLSFSLYSELNGLSPPRPSGELIWKEPQAPPITHFNHIFSPFGLFTKMNARIFVPGQKPSPAIVGSRAWKVFFQEVRESPSCDEKLCHCPQTETGNVERRAHIPDPALLNFDDFPARELGGILAEECGVYHDGWSNASYHDIYIAAKMHRYEVGRRICDEWMALQCWRRFFWKEGVEAEIDAVKSARGD